MSAVVRRHVSVVAVTALVGSVLGVVGVVAEAVAPPGSRLAAPEASAITSPDGLGYIPLAAPCRAADTRIAGGTLAPGATRSLQIRGFTSLAAQGGNSSGCAVPPDAQATEMSITAVSPTGANGFVRAFPSGSTVNAAFLNYSVGRGITNTGTVPLGGSSVLDLGVANFGGTIHLVVDVQGYFVPTGGTAYVPLSEPCRVVDTRAAGGAIPAGGTRSFQVAGTGAAFAAQGGPPAGCGVPDGVPGVEIAVTVISPVGTGFARVAPNSGALPAAAFINYTDGTGITNTGTVTLSDAEPLDLLVQNLGGTVHVRVDVQGYFTTGAGQGARYQTVTPCRTVDTRNAGGPLAAGRTRTFQTAGTGLDLTGQGTPNVTGCGVPQRASAVEASITAVAPAGTGFTQIAPAGTLPTSTFLNYTPVGGITNTGTLPLSLVGTSDLGIRNLGGSAAYLVDVLGYYEPLPAFPRSAETIDSDEDHTCAVVGGGRVRCWGDNASFQIGDGGDNDAWTPAWVLGLSDAVAVANGSRHSCALRLNGTVSCWGANGLGQIGDGTITPRFVPRPVTGLVDVLQIAAGGDHTCALVAGGTVRCWGDGALGQIGDGSTATRGTPVTVTGLSGVVSLSASRFHTCALRSDGTARCWGANGAGEVGDGTTTQRNSPVAVVGLTGAIRIAAAPEHTCALLATGGARCWGANSAGQLGDGTTTPRLTPVTVAGLGSAVALSVAGAHSCAVLDDGSARCWGANSAGQLGDGTNTNRSVPTAVLASSARIVEVTAGAGHTCALTIDIGLGNAPETRCWGTNDTAQLGESTGFPATIPIPVGGEAGVVSVAAGSSHSCSVQVDGLVACWGANGSGQLGIGTTGGTANTPSGVDVSGVVQVVAGVSHTCALRFDGTVRCWGDASVGQLGDGITGGGSATPVRVLNVFGSPLSDVVELSAGSNHTCAVLGSGGVVCWGFNFFGQLGDGTTDLRNRATPVTGLVDTVWSVAAGGNHTCASTSDLTLQCWGSNLDGQLGNGTSGNTATTPGSGIFSDAGVLDVSAGGAHTCAQMVDSAMACWGQNTSGQTGDGTTTSPRATPVLAGVTIGAAGQVGAGGAHSCAITWAPFLTDLRCWGANGSGQLARGTTSSSEPTPSPALTNTVGLTRVTEVATGGNHTCAVRPDFGDGGRLIGAVWCWGFNDLGQVGDGTLTQRSVAVPVTGA